MCAAVQRATHGSATGFPKRNSIATRWNSCSSRRGDASSSSYSPSTWVPIPGRRSFVALFIPPGTVGSCVSSLPIPSGRRVLLAVTHHGGFTAEEPRLSRAGTRVSAFLRTEDTHPQGQFALRSLEANRRANSFVGTCPASLLAEFNSDSISFSKNPRRE